MKYTIRFDYQLIYAASKIVLLSFFLASSLSGCFGPIRPSDGLGPSIDWSELPGWQSDKHAQAWPALLQNCRALGKRKSKWNALCSKVQATPSPTDEQARLFFESHFMVKQILHQADDKPDGLITGYYEPILNGNDRPTERYRYPVYKRPDNLLVVKLGDLYPELKGKRIRARVDSRNQVVPYFDRAQIEGKKNPLRGNEIAWVDDLVALFFAHIQGSAKIQFPDGHRLSIGYHDQNGHPYYAIGRKLIETGKIAVEDMSMQAIEQWLLDNPQQSLDLLNRNPSYVFFTVRKKESDFGAVGSLGVPLTAQRSIAVDPRSIPLGSPVWLSTDLPSPPDSKLTDPTAEKRLFQHLVFAQDTGGAIKGGVRADLFWGNGDQAKYYAGKMRQSGRLYLLIPKLMQARN